MTSGTRTRSKLHGPGPYLAEITNHLDRSAMGGLEVVLLHHTPAGVNSQSNTYPVKYLSPFYGVTSARFQGNDGSKFDDAQKSYGMWMVPPDIGTTVMVIFVDSDPNQGYWIGCVPDTFQNQMVPGIAASAAAFVTPDLRKKYLNASALPVAEYNKKVYDLKRPDIESIPRPVHPFADVLLNQGLLLDDIRGTTTSSARRERPSKVFGISTPGPLDDNGKQGLVGYTGEGSPRKTPVSRLGGTTFVMDDGDINGDNELVRIRTRTGHQILLHNSKDLIYIANSRGTAWLEFTSDGKIDIYAADSVSIHTEGDFNLRADRDFNLDAGRNFNINTQKGSINLNAGSDFNLAATNLNTDLTNDYSLSVDGNSNIVIGKAASQSTRARFSIISEEAVAIKAASDISLKGQKSIQVDSPVTIINPGSAKTKPLEPAPATPPGINLFAVPTTKTNDGAFTPTLSVAMQRVPMHEPWVQHEDTSPATFSKTATDAASNTTTAPGKTKAGNVVTAATALYKTKPGVDAGVVRGVRTPWSTDKPFLDEVKRVCKNLGFPPIELIAGMNLETIRSFDPAIKNPDGSATGLIQFLESTICVLSGGKLDARGRVATPGSESTASLSYMSRVDQMKWVEKYFKDNGWPNKNVPNPTVVNIYLTIFLPAGKFSGSDVHIASTTFRPDAYYANAKNFDPGNLGYFTPGMIAPVIAHYKTDAIKVLAAAGLGPDLEPLSK